MTEAVVHASEIYLNSYIEMRQRLAAIGIFEGGQHSSISAIKKQYGMEGIEQPARTQMDLPKSDPEDGSECMATARLQYHLLKSEDKLGPKFDQRWATQDLKEDGSIDMLDFAQQDRGRGAGVGGFKKEC